VSELTPALPVFAMLRRYCLAVLNAAETAANLAIIMKTTGPANLDEGPAQVGDSSAGSGGTVMDFERGMATFMPEGWEPFQVKAEQPATTFPMAKREFLNEIARCLNIPYNVAACDSSAYNFASGRLDHKVYHRSLQVEQDACEMVVLDNLFADWASEASRLPGYLSDNARRYLLDPARTHEWFWPGFLYDDPLKAANAQQVRLTSHTTTLAAEYAAEGIDWRKAIRQAGEERKALADAGLLMEQPQQTQQPQQPQEEDIDNPDGPEAQDDQA
jgi:capsid protein